MENKTMKIGLLLIAAVLLVALAFAGAGAATVAEDDEDFGDSFTASSAYVGNYDDLQSNLTKKGDVTVYLSANIEMPGNITIKKAGNKTIDLMGFNITQNSENSDEDRLFVVSGDNVIFTIMNATGKGSLKNVFYSGNGGAVYVKNNATFVLSNVTIENCIADMCPAVYVKNATFRMSNARIEDCKANGAGAVRVIGSEALFMMTDGSIIDNCLADTNAGGAVRVENGAIFTMNDSIISNCSATLGGAVLISNATFTMDHSVIKNCTATKSGGGGVDVGTDSDFYMTNGSVIEYCYSGLNGGGGGVLVDKIAFFELSDGFIRNCIARNGQNGGGVYINKGGFFGMVGGTIENCTSSQNGGGVYISYESEYSPSSFQFYGGTIKNCTALQGGAGICLDKGTVNIKGTAKVHEDNDVLLNTTDVYIYMEGSEFTSPDAGIKNITLCSPLTAWIDRSVVVNGAGDEAHFALSSDSRYNSYGLVKFGNDLIFAKTPVVIDCTIENVSNTQDFYLNLSSTDGIITRLEHCVAGTTKHTFKITEYGDDTVYTIVGNYTDASTGGTSQVTKSVTVKDNKGTVTLDFPNLNVSSEVKQPECDPELDPPEVAVDGLDSITKNIPQPAQGKEIVIGFTTKEENYNSSNPDHTILHDEITKEHSTADIRYLNFSITNVTRDSTTKIVESTTPITTTDELITIYIASDFTNRENIQVWEVHDSQTREFTKITREADKDDGKFMLDGTKGVYIYSTMFSEYTISSTAKVNPTPYVPSSSGQTGYTQILQETPTATPTATPGVPTIAPSTKPTTQPTQKSPAPFVGLIAGLGAVLMLARMRK